MAGHLFSRISLTSNDRLPRLMLLAGQLRLVCNFGLMIAQAACEHACLPACSFVFSVCQLPGNISIWTTSQLISQLAMHESRCESFRCSMARGSLNESSLIPSNSASRDAQHR